MSRRSIGDKGLLLSSGLAHSGETGPSPLLDPDHGIGCLWDVPFADTLNSFNRSLKTRVYEKAFYDMTIFVLVSFIASLADLLNATLSLVLDT